MSMHNVANVFDYVFTKLAELPKSQERDRVAKDILTKRKQYSLRNVEAEEALRELSLK